MSGLVNGLELDRCQSAKAVLSSAAVVGLFDPDDDGQAQLFAAGKTAVVLNVGTLVQPTTKAQYSANSVKLPPKLFSHNDQQSYFQASNPEGATSGWGGRIGDLFQSGQQEVLLAPAAWREAGFGDESAL